MIFDTDPLVVQIAYEYVIVESIIFFAFITLFIANSTLQGIKQPFIIPYISVYRQVIMPGILLYIVVKVLNLDILYLWITVGIVIYSAAIWVFFYTKRKLETLANRKK